MDDRRKFPRFAIELDAQYTTEKGKSGPCKLTDISREGTRIELFSIERLDIGTGIKLEISAPNKTQPIASDVIVMWSKELEGDTEFNFCAGGLLSKIRPEDKDHLLDLAYAIFRENKG